MEVRIPFKSLRYGNVSPVRMALIFERRVSRRSEHGTYAPLDPKVGPNFLTQNIPIEFADIRHDKLVEILPDAVDTYQAQRVGPRLERVSSGPEAGLTAKYGLTPELVFDGAVNPDFSQVEADAGQIDINRRYASSTLSAKTDRAGGRIIAPCTAWPGGHPRRGPPRR